MLTGCRQVLTFLDLENFVAVRALGGERNGILRSSWQKGLRQATTESFQQR